MNEIMLVLEIIIIFGLLVLAHKLFKKDGLVAWVCLASVIANVITAKNATIFGCSTAIGSVMFASTFLATDALTECYGAKEARKAVYMGLCSTFLFVVSSQIALLYIPSAIDYADGAMRVLFDLNLRISLASMLMYFVANMADVYLYEKLREKTNGRYMWLRNNISTILCNCLENFFFIGLAFAGIYSFTDILIIALSTSAIEAIVGLCDTPFLYITTKGKRVSSGAV